MGELSKTRTTSLKQILFSYFIFFNTRHVQLIVELTAIKCQEGQNGKRKRLNSYSLNLGTMKHDGLTS